MDVAVPVGVAQGEHIEPPVFCQPREFLGSTFRRHETAEGLPLPLARKIMDDGKKVIAAALSLVNLDAGVAALLRLPAAASRLHDVS